MGAGAVPPPERVAAFVVVMLVDGTIAGPAERADEACRRACRNAAHLDGGTACTGGRPESRLPPSHRAHPSPQSCLRAVRCSGASGLPCAYRRAAGVSAHLPVPRTGLCRARGCAAHGAVPRTGLLLAFASPRLRRPVLLALTRGRSGRTWRLTDACAACAAATSHTAVVPATLLAPRRPGRAGRRPAPPGGPAERARVRQMLTYLGAALPQFTSPAARLLALQCALRADTHGYVRLPDGLLRQHATARPQRAVGGTGTRQLAAPRLRQALTHRRTAIGCRSPLPATGQPSPGPRRTLGPAPHPTGAVGRAASIRATDRTCPGHTPHLGRCRQCRHGGARPPVRTLTPPDHRTPRPTGRITHTGHPAAQPGNRRSLLAPAPTAHHSAAR